MHRWRSLEVLKRGAYLRVEGSMSPTFEVIDAGQNYEVVRVTGTPPLHWRDPRNFETDAKGLANQVILPREVPEGMTVSKSGRDPERTQVRRLVVPGKGEPATLRNAPVVQGGEHRLSGERRIPSALGPEAERTGTVKPELLVTRRQEVIAVEATMQSDWDLENASPSQRGERMRKRGQLQGYIFSLGQAVPKKYIKNYTIRIIFIAPDRPSGATLNELQEDLQQFSAGMPVRIQWFVVPTA
jgi:hypothetical protein